MPRAGSTFSIPASGAHLQLTTGAGNTLQTQTISNSTNAMLLSARAQNVYVTFDGTTPSTTNGIEIIAGAQPVLIPLGFMGMNKNALNVIGAAANAILNIVQLS